MEWSNKAIHRKISDHETHELREPRAEPDQLPGEKTIFDLLKSYLVPVNQLASLGFPVEVTPGYVSIVLQPPPARRQQQPSPARRQQQLDTNAREFVPSIRQQQLDTNAREFVLLAGGRTRVGGSLEGSGRKLEVSLSDGGSELRDVEAQRCTRTYYMSRGSDVTIAEDQCKYHWGRLGGPGYLWSCCEGREDSRGCATAPVHVSLGLVPGFNGPLEGFVRTQPAPYFAADGDYGVYAIDAEMVFTRRGLELARVTLVALDGKVAYEALVRPDTKVLDYNTRFSGLRERDIAGATRNLRNVQRELLKFINEKTILIGHAVHNDLRVLRLLHDRIIDTSVTFPHHLGHPYKQGLKALARTQLGREIQKGEHSSEQDARAALALVLTKIYQDLLHTEAS